MTNVLSSVVSLQTIIPLHVIRTQVYDVLFCFTPVVRACCIRRLNLMGRLYSD